MPEGEREPVTRGENAGTNRLRVRGMVCGHLMTVWTRLPEGAAGQRWERVNRKAS